MELRSERRLIEAADVLEWSRAVTPLIQVATARDVAPGGFAMAMAPLLLDWGASSPGYGADDYYTVHNVNVLYNPVGGELLLGTVYIPGNSVERVEFVIVVSKLGRQEADIRAHAMLRFLFKEGRCPLVLDNHGTALARDFRLPDLVLSWEAWRPPGARFDPVKGLDPETYALTPRLLSGSTRCLSDCILDRPWRCFPLRLPDVPHAGDELLYVGLLLGDAVARHTIGGILDQRIGCGQSCPDGYDGFDAQEWAAVKRAIQEQDLPEDPIQGILGSIKYHLLQRSCVSLALITIDWAIVRMHEQLGLKPPPRIKVTPDSVPTFLDKLAQGERRAALLRAPAALLWLIRHQSALPGKAEQLLDEAGLLQHDENGVVMTHYDNRTETPYGRVQDNLVY